MAAQRYAARGALPSTHATLSSSRATKDRGASSQSPTAARAARDPDRPRRVRRVSTAFAGTLGRAEADVDVVPDELRVRGADVVARGREAVEERVAVRRRAAARGDGEGRRAEAREVGRPLAERRHDVADERAEDVPGRLAAVRRHGVAVVLDVQAHEQGRGVDAEHREDREEPEPLVFLPEVAGDVARPELAQIAPVVVE